MINKFVISPRICFPRFKVKVDNFLLILDNRGVESWRWIGIECSPFCEVKLPLVWVSFPVALEIKLTLPKSLARNLG